MAAKKPKSNTSSKSSSKKTTKKSKLPNLKKELTEKQRLLVGGLFFLLGLAIFISLVSYFFTWQADQSIVNSLDRTEEKKNLLQVFGANMGNLLVFNGFGVMAFIFPILLILSGLSYFIGYGKEKLKSRWLRLIIYYRII